MAKANQNNYREFAECKGSDPNLFFPVKGTRGQKQAKEAKASCASCTVAYYCITEALESNSKGIWGGTTERERKKTKGEYPVKLGSYITQLEFRLFDKSA